MVGVQEISGCPLFNTSFFRLCLAVLVVFPQCHRFVDVFLLALLAAATEQDNDLQTVFRQVNA